MGDKSSIEWTDATWNPVTGCTKVSTGCKHCYAERLFHRPYPGRKFTDVRCHPGRLDQPLRWRKPRRVFVNSMSDLFHEDVPDQFIREIFATMRQSPRHTFQILTKRAARLLSWTLGENDGMRLPLGNVWLIVSIENQQTADERIPLLLQTPAAVRGVSCEPLLGPIDFDDWRFRHETRTRSLDWVIVGGESGPKARFMDLVWAENIVGQCRAAGVPVFVKQLGGWPDKRGDMATFPESLQVREYPYG